MSINTLSARFIFTWLSVNVDNTSSTNRYLHLHLTFKYINFNIQSCLYFIKGHWSLKQCPKLHYLNVSTRPLHSHWRRVFFSLTNIFNNFTICYSWIMSKLIVHSHFGRDVIITKNWEHSKWVITQRKQPTKSKKFSYVKTSIDKNENSYSGNWNFFELMRSGERDWKNCCAYNIK